MNAAPRARTLLGRVGDPLRFRTETMKTTTTLLDEFVVNVFNVWLRREILHRIDRIAEGSV